MIYSAKDACLLTVTAFNLTRDPDVPRPSTRPVRPDKDVGERTAIPQLVHLLQQIHPVHKGSLHPKRAGWPQLIVVSYSC